ncbi:hypothetical protein CRG98_016823 [Punica granatum]|uniref:DUF7745 domain-containing protein n=1 Tax=Punica granatum TaxID=22663 RepID=A0A2I0K3R8_PUNGR|nr:hypothetical protein CRG98_016823 [Punica granatum]
MDRPAPGLRLEAITPPRQDIMRIWRTLRPVDHAFVQGIIGDMVMFAEIPVDWIFLRTAAEFWDPEHAVFNFHGTELAPMIEEYTTLIQRPTPTTHSIFVPNPFPTVQGQLSTLLHIPAQNIHEELHERGLTPPQRSQAAPTPRATSTLAPETESSIQAAMHAELRTIREERDRLRCELIDSRVEVADYRELQTELTRARAPVAHLDREMARLSAELDRRLRMAEGDHADISEEVNPSVSTLSQPLPTHAPPPLTPAGVLSAYSGALPTHLPPPASSGAPLPPISLTSAAIDDQARIAALEGTVNQMATNMAELFALLRGPNRASSSSTPPPTQAPEKAEAPAPPTLHTSTVHPFTTQLPPLPAPTAIPLPPATFLSSEHILSAPPPVSIPAPAMAYTIPPPMVFPASSAPALTHLQAVELPPYPSLQPHASLSYQAPPPVNTTFHEPGTPTHAA